MPAPVKGKGFDRLTRLEAARSRFLRLVPRGPLAVEQVPTGKAWGRVLARPLRAPRDVPPFDRAAMDGFAVRAKDTFGAGPGMPLPLLLRGASRAGGASSGVLREGRCRRIATGAKLPAGADAVVMLEDCRERAGGLIEVERAVTPGENVSAVGEDVRRGEPLWGAGTRLFPADVALASALGLARLALARAPRVGVLACGDELRTAGRSLRKGQVFDANRPGALAALAQEGAVAVDLGVAPDNVDAIARRLRAARARCDALVVSGGTSVGARDFVPEAVARLGRPGLVVHGVGIRPGYPVGLGAAAGTPIVALPGSPVAALLCLDAFVLPAVRRMLGEVEPALPRGATVRARAARRIPGAPGLTTFARVALHPTAHGLSAEPLRVSGSGILSSLVKGDGLVVIPHSKEGIEEGEDVEVRLLRPLAARGPPARRGA